MSKMWKKITMRKMWTGEHLSNVITPDISRDQSKCGEIEKLSIFVLSTPIPHLPGTESTKSHVDWALFKSPCSRRLFSANGQIISILLQKRPRINFSFPTAIYELQ